MCAQLRTITGIIYAILDFDAVELERNSNSTSPKLWLTGSSCIYTGEVCEKLGLALRELLVEHQASAGACHTCQTSRKDKVALSLMGAHAWRQCWQITIKQDTVCSRSNHASCCKLHQGVRVLEKVITLRQSRPLWVFSNLL